MRDEEEKAGEKKNKQPVFITLPDEKPFAFAGLWQTWHNKDHQDAPYRSCTINTREASECLKDIHDRMPSILHPDTYDASLDQRNQDGKGLQEILAERTVTEFKFRPPGRLGFNYVLKFLFQPGNPIIILYKSVIIDHSRGDRIDNGCHSKTLCP